MLDYLKQFDSELEKKVKTLEVNIRSASPSFFDTFRSVAEFFIRRIAKDLGIDTNSTSFKKLISIPELKSALTDKLEIPVYAIEKCQDYIAKINKHVHESEKEINENLVVDYILCLYELTAPVCENATPPEISEILSLYNSLDREIEKEKARLIREQNQLISENNELLQRVNQKLQDKNTNSKSAYEKESKEAESKKIITEFTRSAKQHLTFGESAVAVNRKRKIALGFTVAALALALIETLFSLILNRTYSTFIFVLNFWHFAMLFILIKLANKSQKVNDINARTIYTVGLNQYGIFTLGKIKRRYKVTFILGLIATAFEIILTLTSEYSPARRSAAPVLVVILIIAAILSVICFVLVYNYFSGLLVTVLTSPTVKKSNGAPFSLYFIVDKFFDEETFLMLRSSNSK